MQAPRTRVPRRPVHGVLLLDKPLGLSSNDALQKAKWLLRAEKAGHTGTLDPLASGVLPLCFGAATKFSHLQLEASKTYRALLNLGVTTRTADAEGEVLQRRPVPSLDAAAVHSVLAAFTGPIWQLPPMHSALKKDGKPLYEYARAGLDVERERRRVEIYALHLLDGGALNGEQMEIEVRCSKGTYIRTLAEDIGEALGCGAHLGALRRMASGGFDLTRCVTLAELEAMPEERREHALLPVEELLLHVPRVTLSAAEAGRFLSGLRRRGHGADAPLVAVFGSDPPSLLGSAHVRAGELIPERLLNPIEISQMNSKLSTTV